MSSQEPRSCAGDAPTRLRAALDRTGEAVLVARPDWTVEYVNAAFERLTGLPADQVVDRPLDQTFLRADRDRALLDELHDAIHRETAWRGRIAFSAADGSPRETEAALHAVRDANGAPNGCVVLLRETACQSDFETRLRQTHKMRALGTLAGGIAHDFNNILQTILGYSSLLSDDIPTDSNAYHYVREICDAGDRAAELVGQIQSLSRQTDLEPLPVLLQPIVKETLNLLRASLPSRIAVHPSVDTHCGHVLADPAQIQEALLELCNNAVQAMRAQGGTLALQLEEVEARPPAQPVPIPGRYVLLTVSDTGPGLSEEMRSRVLAPQPPATVAGRTRGRGLDIVHEVLDRHHVSLDVRTQPGHGTTFEIYFPRCQPASAASTVHETAPAWAAAGRILFVDDEIAIAQMAKAALERYGFEVVACTHSLIALKEFRANPDRFDVVVTDEVMPELAGSQMAQEMLQVRPDLPIIICSGFSRKLEELQVGATGVRVFLRKPFVAAELARHIRTLLREKRQSAASATPPVRTRDEGPFPSL